MTQGTQHLEGHGFKDPQPYRRSVTITVNLSAIRANLVTARRLSGGCKQFATIKADAYGHGAVEVAHALSPRYSTKQYSDPSAISTELPNAFADGFSVVTLDEGIELRRSGIKQSILILQGPQSVDAAKSMVRYDLWPVIHDLHQYEWYRLCSSREKLDAWLKIDTGMGRLGVRPAEASTILDAADGVRWRGLLTHFACADETDNTFTDRQIDSFVEVAANREYERSMANSAGVLAWPRSMADWARPGIMLYGCNPLDTTLPEGTRLLPAMSVKAPLISVKKLPAGAGVGYAQTWHCPEDMPVGYVALGYRDGLPRVLDSSASVCIEGEKCPIIGRVSMDSVAVDLRGRPDVLPGVSAEFWGRETSIDDLASAAGTISYELLTSIRGRRLYITENQNG
ncbi:MAG: alanine racemase [Granulosicoccus sp.]